MKNFITLNNEIGMCNHPMIEDDQMDYNFNLAEDSYEEWLFSGGELFSEEDEDDYSYPSDGFWK